MKDIVILCRTCGFQTRPHKWSRGKNKYTCYCDGLDKFFEAIKEGEDENDGDLGAEI